MIIDIANFIGNIIAIAELPLHSKSLKKYQNRWIKLFNEVITNPFLEELLFRTSQNFSIPVTITDNLILNIQISIPATLKELDQLDLPIIEIPLNQFVNSNNKQCFPKSENLRPITYALDESINEVSNEPIIISTSLFYRDFVLDGNHRVDYAKRHNKETINAFVLPTSSLLTTPHLFEDRISYLLFCFLEDIAKLQHRLSDRPLITLFGFLKIEELLLRHHSILPTVEKAILYTSQRNQPV